MVGRGLYARVFDRLRLTAPGSRSASAEKGWGIKKAGACAIPLLRGVYGVFFCFMNTPLLPHHSMRPLSGGDLGMTFYHRYVTISPKTKKIAVQSVA